ncbi:GNAT family N-acetyltransferase [Burkholderia cepacia]|uniref:GNAT family N-acetyltransferase n=1 Tax=Burkholderia cepacia TaxID=292 RepID=UPI0024464BDB|nr:GNAT family N-acetyltransferase [Burkholderia cepacia]
MAARIGWVLSFDTRIQGMCVLSESNHARDMNDGRRVPFMKLEFIVTLPGTKGYGRAMLEKVVNYSEKCGHSGRIMVEALQNSRALFETAGFANQGSTMYPDPHESERWSMVERTWKLEGLVPESQPATSRNGNRIRRKGREAMRA